MNLRSFLSLIEQDDVGVYISLGGFTRGAEESARRASRRITLIDGDAFLDLWVEHYDRVDEDGRQLLPIKPVYSSISRRDGLRVPASPLRDE